MNILTKIIITDTNIITDLNNANLLEKFVNLDNVYISDMIKNDEINSKTGNIKLISKFKVLSSTSKELIEMTQITAIERKLSTYDILNFVLAKNNNCILATGDDRLKKYSEKNGVEVIRLLKIIELMKENKVITYEEAITSCKLLKENERTSIPKDSIDALINKLEKSLKESCKM